jgi:putative transposase
MATLESNRKRLHRKTGRGFCLCGFHPIEIGGIWCNPIFACNPSASVCKELKSELIELETMPDHVHMLVEVDPQLGIHRLVKHIKGVSSRYLWRELPSLRSRLPSLWTNSYFVSTVGGAPREVVKQYIDNKKNV